MVYNSIYIYIYTYIYLSLSLSLKGVVWGVWGLPVFSLRVWDSGLRTEI